MNDITRTSNQRVAALRLLHDKLKSGEYNGTDVMAAWIAVEDLACLLERTTTEQHAEPFVVKHYADDPHPTIKGNGFDGLVIGDYRDEAEKFIAWVNARLSHEPPADDHQADYAAALQEIAKGPPGHLPNDEVASWAGQIASDALSLPPRPSQPPRPGEFAMGESVRVGPFHNGEYSKVMKITGAQYFCDYEFGPYSADVIVRVSSTKGEG